MFVGCCSFDGGCGGVCDGGGGGGGGGSSGFGDGGDGGSGGDDGDGGGGGDGGRGDDGGGGDGGSGDDGGGNGDGGTVHCVFGSGILERLYFFVLLHCFCLSFVPLYGSHVLTENEESDIYYSLSTSVPHNKATLKAFLFAEKDKMFSVHRRNLWSHPDRDNHSCLLNDAQPLMCITKIKRFFCSYTTHRLVGPVVSASASRVADTGSIQAFVGIFYSGFRGDF